MKCLVSWLALAWVAVSFAAEPATIPELDGPRAKYEQALTKIHTDRDQQLAPVNRTYAERLDMLHHKMDIDGNFTGVSAVEDEQQRFLKGLEPSVEERRAMPGLLRVQRTSFEKERSMVTMAAAQLEAQANAAWAAGLQQLYHHLLDPLQTDKTAPAKAAVVKAEIDRFAAAQQAAAAKKAAEDLAAAAARAIPPAPAPTNPAAGAPSNPPAPALESPASVRQTALALVRRLKLTNATTVTKPTEAEEVLAGAVSRQVDLLKDVKSVSLLSVFDIASPPMKHNGGEAQKVEGSFAETSIVGSNKGIMLWGPYAKLEEGRYAIVYRFRFAEKTKGRDVCFLDVATNAKTLAGVHPDTATAPGLEWLEIGVPLVLEDPKFLEFRMWPHNRPTAFDRIYVYRLE